MKVTDVMVEAAMKAIHGSYHTFVGNRIMQACLQAALDAHEEALLNEMAEERAADEFDGRQELRDDS